MTMAVQSNIPTAIEDATPVPGERLTRPFQRFAALSSAGGIVLLICTVVALVWANAGEAAYEAYHNFVHAHIDIGVGSWHLGHGHMSVGHFINDALMAIFFLLVGLEIKREILVGELSDIKKATLPIAGAIGGMVAPALIYVMFNLGGEGVGGWGVPMATDIAFALGILALLGRRVPNSLRIFLTSLAIADDLGALLVIALFYTDKVHFEYLAGGAGIVALLVCLNMLGFKRAIWFLLPGVVLWYCFLESGVHATIAGVVLAATIPVRPRVKVSRYSAYTRAALDCFDKSDDPTQDIRTNSSQRAAVFAIEKNSHDVLPLLHRLEHGLHGWVAFLIIPIFALANAGLHLSGDMGSALGSKVSLGVIMGLFIGKPLGITLFAWIAVKLGLGSLSKGVSWRHMIGAACLGGIGFTMALFIATLGFKDSPEMLDQAKLGILVASALSAFAGLGILLTCPEKPEPEPDEIGPLVETPDL
jgi:NhaA family Na+:H+ antiporter